MSKGNIPANCFLSAVVRTSAASLYTPGVYAFTLMFLAVLGTWRRYAWSVMSALLTIRLYVTGLPATAGEVWIVCADLIKFESVIWGFGISRKAATNSRPAAHTKTTAPWI